MNVGKRPQYLLQKEILLVDQLLNVEMLKPKQYLVYGESRLIRLVYLKK
jgi:hypothetical protein